MSAPASPCDPVASGGVLRRERAALGELVRFMLPVMTGSVVSVGADRWTLAFVGHWDFKDRSHYDGAGIGKLYSNITALSLGVSASIGLATFCAQAHGAGKSRELNPVFFRRALVMFNGLFVFAMGSAIICEPVLLSLGQPAAVARTSAHFAQVQVVGVPFYWVSQAMNIALNAAKLTLPGLVMQLVSSFTQVVLCVLLMHPSALNLGYLGMAAARSLGGIVSLATLVVFVRQRNLQGLVWQRHPDAEPVFKPGAFPTYLRVSIPAALVVWSEWWAFEVLSILVGLTPDAELNLAAHGTMFNIIVVFYMCWTATCTGVCALVGNLLGAGRNDDVPPLLRAAGMLSLATSLTIALVYELFKGAIASMFTSDERVEALLCNSSIGVVLSVPLYAQLMTFYGALRGANKQRAGILGTFFGYWVIGLPLGGLLGCKLGWPTPLVGVWLGNVIALAIASSTVCWSTFWGIDWLSVRRVSNGRAALLGSEQEHRQSAGGASKNDQASREEAERHTRARGA